jgi:hypothetical protein
MMQRRTFFAFALAGASLLALSGCDAGPTIEFNYKLTVEVDTPEGVRSGHSVIKYWGKQRSSNPLDPYKGGVGAHARGEAVAVDLPGGRTLFALLQTETDVDAATAYPGIAFAAEIKDEADNTKRLQLLKGLKGQTRPLPRTEMALPNGGTEVSAYPMLVTFKDIKDPKSVERVNSDDLAASFGVGYRLKSITITITDEPITTGIEKRLGWLPKVYQFLKGTDFQPKDIPVGDFKRLFSTEVK